MEAPAALAPAAPAAPVFTANSRWPGLCSLLPVRLALLAVLLASCVAPVPEGDVAPIFGGQEEAGYPATGYLVLPTLWESTHCAATMIGPRLAVTAAHCVLPRWKDNVDHVFPELWMGFGAFADRATRTVKVEQILPHPAFNGFRLNGVLSEPPARDLALLVLAASDSEGRDTVSPVPVQPAEEVQAVGYGMTSPTDVTPTVRKSLSLVVEAIQDDRIVARSPDGTICFGDSGGPLMSADGIAGVATQLEQPPPGEPECKIGRSATWTSLTSAPEAEFIECVRERSLASSSLRYPNLLCHPLQPFIEGMGELNQTPAGARFEMRQAATAIQQGVMVARALGLTPVRSPRPDARVSQQDWGLFQAAVQAGLVPRPLPDDVILTSGELMPRLFALATLAHGLGLPGSPQLEHLRGLVDLGSIYVEQRVDLDAAAAAGLMVNFPDPNAFRPSDVMRVGEWTAILYQVLVREGKRPPLSSPCVFAASPG
jgi:trypsin